MTVKDLIKMLQSVEDKTLPIRVIEEKDNDDPNYWLRPIGSVEVSNTGENGYQECGELRLIGTEQKKGENNDTRKIIKRVKLNT